jgi:cytosine/adenosine deaminase-related metal-dependent hydrolase
MPADLVVLDYEAMAYDVIEGMADEQDVLLTRANNRHIRHVFVAGRQIVRDGRVLGIDMEEVEREVLAQARAAGARMRELKPVMDRSIATLDNFYRSGEHARTC